MQEDEPRDAPRMSGLGDLPPDAKLLIVDSSGRVVREIERNADGQLVGPIALEPGQGIAVLTVKVGVRRRMPWQLMVRILVVHVLALIALVYAAVLLLPSPWWMTVTEAAAVLGALVGRHIWQHHRQSKANERRETQ